MLELTIKIEELFDEETNSFIVIPETTIQLEHSLLALSKWEAKYNIPFLGAPRKQEEKTKEQIFDYIKFMVLGPTPDDLLINNLGQEDFNKINSYIESPQSATTFGELPEKRASREVITSELIYYWMVAFTIPFECETWNLNRLFSLIKICNIKNAPASKMPKHSIAARNRELNKARREQYGSKG